MMLQLAWRNLWRRPTRTVLSVTSITLATLLLVFMLSFQLGTYDTMKSNALKIFDGMAQIQPNDYKDDPDIRKVIAAPEALSKAALSIGGVTAASPRASSYAILANGDLGYGAAIAGIDPAQESHISTLATTIRKGRYLRVDDSDAIIMGDALARNLKLSVGDRVTLLGSAMDGTVAADSLELVGVFQSGLAELDRQLAEIPLVRFQESFAMEDKANIIVLSGHDLASVNDALPQLAKAANERGLVVRDWGELQPALKEAIRMDMATSSFLYATLVIVVVFIILNTLLMSVLERTREFGMLMAIGMRPGLAARMLWLELILLALIGTVIGLILGSAVTLWAQKAGIVIAGTEGLLAMWGLPERLYPALTTTSALVGPVAILFSVALGGLVPVMRITRLEPVTAMREG